MLSWHSPDSKLQSGRGSRSVQFPPKNNAALEEHYIPWHVGRFEDVEDVANYWSKNYDKLREKSALFADCFYDTTLPPSVVEAAAANLTILKSPTVLRQAA